MIPLPNDAVRVEVAPGADAADPATWNGAWQRAVVRENDPVTIRPGVQSEGQSTDSTSCDVTVDNRDGRWVPENPLGVWFGQIGEDTPLRVIWDGDLRAETEALSFDNRQFDGIATVDPFDAPSVEARAAGLLMCGWCSAFSNAGFSDWAPPVGMTSGEQTVGSDISHFRAAWQAVSAGPTGVRAAEHGLTGTPILGSFSAVLPGATTVVEEVSATPFGDFFNGVTQATLTTDPGTQVGQWVVAVVVRGSDYDDEPGTPGGDPGFWRPLFDSRRAANRPSPDLGLSPGLFAWARPVTESGTQTVTLDLRNFTVDHLRVFVVDQLDIDHLTWMGVDRFQGFISELPLTWDRSGNEATATVRANGVLRRLQAGTEPATSVIKVHATHTLERAILRRPWGYWPLEGTDLSSPLGGVAAFIGDGIEPGQAPNTLPASDPMLRLPTGSRWEASPATTPPATLGLPRNRVSWLYFMDEPPSGTTSRVAMRVGTTHEHSARFDVRTSATEFIVRRFDEDGVVSTVTAPILDDFYGNWHVFEFDLSITNGILGYRLRVARIGEPIETILSFSTGQPVADVGRITKLGPVGPMGQDRAMGHLYVENMTVGRPNILEAVADGRTGETAADRVARIADDRGDITARVIGDAGESMPMGVQRPLATVPLLRELEDADDGILYDDGPGLRYRTRTSMYNQAVAWVLQRVRDARPVRDDRQLVTDVTVSRPFGGSARAVLSGGPVRSTELERNVADDALLPALAGWILDKGTQPLLRWPKIKIQIHADAAVLDQWLQLRIGDRITWDQNLIGLAGVDVDLIVVGWEERITSVTYDVEINAAPAAPFIGALFSDGTDDAMLGRFDTDGSEIGEDIDDAQTSFFVVSESPPLNPDPGFENANTPALWEVSNGWFTSTTDQAFRGRRSGLITPNGSGNPAEVSTLTDDLVVTANGQLAYQASVWVFAPAGVPSTVRVSLIFGPDGGEHFEDVAVDPGEWAYLVVQAAADQPNGVLTVGMSVRINGSPSSSEVLYVDDARVSLLQPLWDTGSTPLTVMAGGERMTVTDIAGTDSPQTFTVVRGANGVVKPHPAGTPIRLDPPPRYLL